MRGAAVFYPVGWDDNGLPTERRAQNYYHVRCDPSLRHDPAFVPPARPGERPVPVSRRNFVELCHRVTRLDEQAFEAVWRRLGLSVDWSAAYRTIGETARSVAQRAFVRNVARGEAYLAEAPTWWDVTFQTSVAQAEVEDREVGGACYQIAFHRAGGAAAAGAPVTVTTARPELLPACVALVVHPDDERHADLVGTTVRTPLFEVEAPVLAHPLADPAHGSGIAMAATFGDANDITWWRELGLATRLVLGRSGQLRALPPTGVTSRSGRAAYRHLARQTPERARDRVVGLLRQSGDLIGEPELVTRSVPFYERGSQPLQIVATRQWFLRNGAHDPALREALLARGRQIRWRPAHLRARYEDWVRGLSADWPVSRQRFFGVPVPVWYPLDDDGVPRYDAPILPPEDALPVDPSAEPPPGRREDERGRPGGFTGETDVLDTWATSSLTPQIAARQGAEGDLMDRVFPMDLRPQAHDIIRTWLFRTVLRSHYEHGALPWRDAAISGWILDPARRRMSTSQGNVVTPMDLLREHGSDAVRHWAARARLGTDMTFDPAQLTAGRKLALKILNASRFALGTGPAPGGGRDAPDAADVSEPLDRAMLARLADVVASCTRALEDYEHTVALAAAERFFWFFCDDYLELVKDRAYGARGAPAARSASGALRLALSATLRLLAPFLPFATEEAWSWWQEGSVHRAPWPHADSLRATAGDANQRVLDAASGAIAALRCAKTRARLSVRAPARSLRVTANEEDLAALAAALPDVRAAGRVREIELRPAPVAHPIREVAV